jgi:hypothetical protein
LSKDLLEYCFIAEFLSCQFPVRAILLYAQIFLHNSAIALTERGPYPRSRTLSHPAPRIGLLV